MLLFFHFIRTRPFRFTLIAVSLAPSATLAADMPEPVTLTPVMVSVTKREEPVRNLNTSLTTVTEQTLDDAGVRDTGALSRVLPGVTISNSGNLLFPIISVRGVTSAQDFYNPALTIYVDGVPQLSTFALQMLTDVDYVELLRGPQGTLYGKSAQGGIINIATHQPGADPAASLDLGVASRNSYHAKSSVRGPLVDGLLYGSLTLADQDQPGNLRNPATGNNHLGGTRGQAGSGRLRLAPDDRPWELNLALSGECTRAYQDVYIPFDDPRSRRLADLPGTPDPHLRRCSGSQSLRGIYNGDDWQLTAVAAWQRLHYARSFPYGTYLSDQPEHWQQNVQELRWSTLGTARFWDAVVGLYRQAVAQQRSSTTYVDVPEPQSAPVARSHNHNETQAAYADATWHLTSALDLGTGVRFSHDSAQIHAGSSYLDTPLFDAANRISKHHTLGQFSAGYQFNPRWRAYARVAQGYKPAGYNLAPSSALDAHPFNAETSLNYELGARYEHDTLSLQAALFRTQTRNMQLYVGTLGYQTIASVGRAHANGAEFNLDWRFLPEWSLGLDGSVTSARFDRFDYDSTLSYAGKRLPYVPRYNADLKVQGEIPVAYGGVLRPGLDLRLAGAQYFDSANTLRQPAYATLDLRLGWRPDERMELAAYAQNVTDRIYRTYAFDGGPSGRLTQINAGRTLGLDLHWTIL